ncbi:MAG: 2Fe-2S ferredoxin-like protein [Neisseriaceae bacterium]|nr:2Fe-2S ferredoxin-like protein [Neisseriaceae bacterium]MBP6861852.1 2Fe-2S ferredoxin-like protein [Neisseriaceae bacterium]
MPTITTQDTFFDLNEGETLLEALERTGHEIEYQCRSGYCGSCRTHLVSGSVTYHQTPLAFIQPGEILPCCCTPAEDIQVAVPLKQTLSDVQADLFLADLFDGNDDPTS